MVYRFDSYQWFEHQTCVWCIGMIPISGLSIRPVCGVYIGMIPISGLSITLVCRVQVWFLSVVRASEQCMVYRFDSCQGLRFFSLYYTHIT